MLIIRSGNNRAGKLDLKVMFVHHAVVQPACNVIVREFLPESQEFRIVGIRMLNNKMA